MEIGQLKHRITFLKPTSNINENGFETEGFIEFKTVWASVSNLSGREYFAAAAIQKEKIVKFKIRSISDIDETMKIAFQGKHYNITSIDNIKYENKYIEVKALEVEENGQA
ncbi:MAG: phage head closure protein [Anaerovoracaceae bacterium]